MGTEIERKFRVHADTWHGGIDEARWMRQGYIETSDDTTVRVRLVRPLTETSRAVSIEPDRLERLADEANDTSEAWLTIKGPPGETDETSHVRPEFEYAIPPDESEEMLDLFCRDRQVSKVRCHGRYEGADWVIDRFGGAHAGLVLAEVELETPDESVCLPEWIGHEVTGEREWTNAALARHPYGTRSSTADGSHVEK